jgi:hypothetical protein
METSAMIWWLPRAGSCGGPMRPRSSAPNSAGILGAVLRGHLVAELAPHFPAHPEEEDATGEQQPDQLQELNGDAGKGNAEGGRRANADDECLVALIGRQAGSGEAYNDGVVAGEHQVDENDLEEGAQRLRSNIQSCESLC